ncbi:MAG: ADOP family duplicated permease, partial [Terriglobales bacterium]
SRPVPILGVLPPNFLFPGNPQVLEPLQPEAMTTGRSTNVINVIGRLKPGVSLAAAQDEMHAIGARLSKEYPQADGTHTVGLVPLQQQWTGSQGPTLWMLFGATGLVLLIACADLANLLLARALGRGREIAVRIALGAEPRRIARQLLTESIVLALLGGAAGLALAYAGMHALLAWAPAAQAVSLTPTLSLHAAMDWPIVAFTLALAVLTGIVFGLAPAWHAARMSRRSSLQQETGRSAGGRSGRTLRRALVIAEISLTLPLLLGAGMLLGNLARLQHTQGGFRADHMLTAHLALSPSRYPTTATVTAFSRRLLTRLRAQPGVRAAALTTVLPFELSPDLPFEIDGKAVGPHDAHDAQYHPSTPETLAAFGIPLLRGRAFNDADTAHSAPVALINEAAAREWWPHQDPVGHSIWLGKPLMVVESAPRTIVGVVGSVRQDGLAQPAPAAIYVPEAQLPDAEMELFIRLLPLALAVRTSGDPGAAAVAVQRAVWSIDPQQPVSDLLPMREVEETALGGRRLNLALLGIFAALALALAAMGIYGVMSYGVAQRTRELGLRSALGATRSQLTVLVLQEGLTMAVGGVVLGTLAAWLLQRLLAHQVSGFASFPPAVTALIAAVLLLVALAASLAPALRAASLDPLLALRQE